MVLSIPLLEITYFCSVLCFLVVVFVLAISRENVKIVHCKIKSSWY